MSGGNASKKSRRKQEGWEEAGAEFYQESYPGANNEQDLFDNLQRADAAKLATLLPSKQVRNTTVKRVRSQNERRQSTFARTTASRDVHLSMLPDLSENLSNEERTWEEIMQIKAMPVPMSHKRDLKAQLQNATKLRLQGLEQFHWRQRKVYHHIRSKFGDFLLKLEPWRSSLKKIEGNFGTGVVSYFLFLRWLLFLNLAISLIILFFLIFPKVFLIESRLNCDFSNYPNSTDCCAESYFSKNLTENIFLDALQGTGWMEKTILFYGVYSDQIYDFKILDFQLYYNMPMAYILVPIMWILISLIAIVKSAANGFKERLVENEGQFYKFCNLIFGGWDFCIHNDTSSKIKHKALFNEIRACIEEEKYKEEKQMRSKEDNFFLFFRRFFINIIVFFILLAAGLIIYLSFNFSSERLNHLNTPMNLSDYSEINLTVKITQQNHETAINQLFNLLLEFLPFLCIVGLNLIVPVIFDNLIKFENYLPGMVIKVTLFRTIFLRLSSLVVLLSQIYSRVVNRDINFCSANVQDDGTLDCWETYVGQQLYKLILTDFVVQFIMTFFINLPRSIVGRHTKNKFLKLLGEQEFYLPKHVLDIVYTQTIVWMGAFFCPFLPIIGTVFYFVIFYIKKFTCLINCTPSPTVYRASKSKSLFMFELLISFVLSIIPVAYTISEIKPSLNCGPFRGLNAVWDFVVSTFNAFPSIIRTAIFGLGTSVFAVPAFAVLLLFLYYYWAVAAANRHMVNVLKNQLVLEGHDKQFLLNRLSAFIRQHQKRCERSRNRASFADDDSRQSSR